MEWYYAKHGKQEGPVDLATVQTKLQSGELAPTDLIWREGMAEWTAAGSVPEVSAGSEAGGLPEGQVASTMAGAASPAGQAPVEQGGGTTYAPQGGISPNMVAAPTSGMAIASLVCGIVGLFLCYLNGLVALPAVICGHMAMKQIDNSPTPVGGRGMAIAGLVTGYLGLLIQLLFIGIIAFAVMQEI